MAEQREQEPELTDKDCIKVYLQIRDDDKHPLHNAFYNIINGNNMRDAVEATSREYRDIAKTIPTHEIQASRNFADVLRPIFKEIAKRSNITFAQIAELAKETNDQKRPT